MDYLEVAKKNNLNVIEISILVYLNRKFPHAASVEEMITSENANWQVNKGISGLINKGLISKDNNKYKIERDKLYDVIMY
ncbi:hypothetical protein [Oceanobacillus damuensis]|uniref:hypothetical protein n=1 Tax=Oceanobacillus damuensis TaxID=937928 RepID=UPI000835E046|nr:hypothetical protein [Oceanobacillus damuensis]